jgi:hypothetical protein
MQVPNVKQYRCLSIRSFQYLVVCQEGGNKLANIPCSNHFPIDVAVLSNKLFEYLPFISLVLAHNINEYTGSNKC